MTQRRERRDRKGERRAAYVDGLKLPSLALAMCRFCRQPLYFGFYQHSRNPRWELLCTPLREVRCDGAFKAYWKNCDKQGAENW